MFSLSGYQIPRKSASARRVFRRVLGSYDSAQTTNENYKHWSGADGLSADAAASSEVRRTIRNRARYEIANNTYARGCVSTIAQYVIGTGPRLQMLTDSPSANREIESLWQEWARAVGLAEKLLTMCMARFGDGEAFGVLTTNPGLRVRNKLDIRLYEADQIDSVFASPVSGEELDGILFDEAGNVSAYRLLKRHPGSSRLIGADWLDSTLIPARFMLHWFRADRPGQHRGVSAIAAALPLYAQLRRYTLAVISAAETAADFAGVLETPAPPGVEPNAGSDDLPLIEIERRMLVPMPEGYKLSQLKPEQPTTTYGEFKREIVNEIARCLNMPFNIAAGNSSGYNYASGRLDHQSYFKSIRVEQHNLAQNHLARILSEWILEGVNVPGYFSSSLVASLLRNGTPIAHQWFWDGLEHVDPQKEANAQSTRLSSHTTTLSAEYAKAGLDWENELRQRARELSMMRDLGIPAAPEMADQPQQGYPSDAEE